MEAAESTETNTPPRVFVSYTHESPDHKRWVAALSTELMAKGVDVVLDQWELKLGDDVTLFMEKGIREADRVLLVCTPIYARKANEGEGGVGYERLVVTGEIASKIDTNKFVCVLRSGTKANAIPVFASTRLYSDFTEDSSYEVALEDLLRDIHAVPNNPKPVIGPNPYKLDSQSPTPSVFGSLFVAVSPTSDLEDLFSRASSLLRKGDLIGWKQLVRNVRADMPLQLNAWRAEVEKASPHREIDDEWLALMHTGFNSIAASALLALVAVDSQIENLKDQRGLLDDLLTFPEWNQSGYTHITGSPRLFAYVYHNLLGAFLLNDKRPTETIQLLRTKIPIDPHAQHFEELWSEHEMLGWSESLGSNLRVSWNFLHSIWDKQPWLKHVFVRKEDVYVGIRAYILFAGLLEFAHFMSRDGNAEDNLNSPRLGFTVPPLFATPMANWTPVSLAKLLSMVVPNHQSLMKIASEFGCDEEEMQALWPKYLRKWISYGQSSFSSRFISAQSLDAPLP